MDFACELMDLCRGTQEVEAVLSGGWGDSSFRDPLARLKMALRYEEKKVWQSSFLIQTIKRTPFPITEFGAKISSF